MKTEHFRQAVVAAIEAWRTSDEPGLPAFYQNAPVPPEDQVGPVWLDQYVRWFGADFVTVGERPRGRRRGSVVVNIYARQGEGTAEADRLLDALEEVFRNLRISAAVIGMPARSPGTEFKGWAKEGILVPFTLDSA